MKHFILSLILLAICSVAYARMYQWTDPDTGTTQLSGKPPHWYRSGVSGPRVIVFENGRVIDDTGIELSEDEDDRLRQDALIMVERDRLAAMEKLLQARRQRAVLESQQEETEEFDEMGFEPLIIDEDETEDEDNTEAGGQPSADSMRALIEEYERMRSQQARGIVESSETD